MINVQKVGRVNGAVQVSAAKKVVQVLAIAFYTKERLIIIILLSKVDFVSVKQHKMTPPLNLNIGLQVTKIAG